MNKPRVLVTGATGAIGRVVSRALSDAGQRVTAVGSAEADVSNAEQLRRLLDEVSPSIVVHLAGIRAGTAETLFGVNAEPLQMISRARGVERVVFASSAALYGDRRVGPLSESSLPLPTSDYGRSKLEGERLLDSGQADSVSLRIFNVFGQGFGTSLVERLRTSSPQAPVIVSGLDDFVRDYVHVADVARAVVAATEVDLRSQHQVFNIGSGSATSNGSLIEQVRAGGEVHFDLGAEISSWSVADISLARRLLAFEPTMSVRDYVLGS